jgi:hypothetical protein
MTRIAIALVRPAKLDFDRLRSLAEQFHLDGEQIEAENAIAINGRSGAVVHGQPTNRMGGVTTAVDLTRGIATSEGEPLPVEAAASMTTEILERHGLGAAGLRSEFELDWRIDARTTEAVTFDGKERRRHPVKTDVRARVFLNEVPVSGPRTGASLTFTDSEVPLRMMVTSWASLERYGERELIEKDEVLAELQSAVKHRNGRTDGLEVRSANLAFWAAPYAGGADLLEPSWFVEVEHTDVDTDGQAPRQLLRLPATR